MILFVSSCCLLAGIFLPLLVVHQFYIFSDEVSILSALADLFSWQYAFIFIVVLVASLFLPFTKHIYLAFLPMYETKNSDWFKWLQQVSRWSMLDVFAVALLVVGIKLNLVLTVEVGLGFYLFTLSALLSLGLSHLGPKYLTQ